MNSNGFLCIALLVLVFCAKLDGYPRIISRHEWQARSPKGKEWMKNSVSYAIIHHGTGSRCFTSERCKRIVKAYQNYHMDTNGWWDIGYNFLIGEDGKIYEGRGWNEIGIHSGSYAINRNSIGIAVIGDFSNQTPNQAAISAVRDLLQYAKESGKLSETYTLCGHRDIKSTQCPGASFYKEIKRWDHYDEQSRC